MNAFDYLVLKTGLFFLFAVISSPIAIVSVWLFKYSDDHEPIRALRWLFGLVGLAWVLGLEWFAKRTAQQMAFENQKFFPAVKHSIFDIRLRLAFLPLIGNWFAPARQGDDEAIAKTEKDKGR
jgi:hypothetical protein